MLVPGFWDDQGQAQKVTKQQATLKDTISLYSELKQLLDDLGILAELSQEEHDPNVLQEVGEELKLLKRRVSKLELDVLLSRPYDRGNAIMSLHAGAGGTEAQDWVEMLLRMFTRWAEDRHYLVSILDLQPGDEAGVKSVTVEIVGPNAFGYLRSEKGVHRLVRISPFDASGRRHTSFASVEVLPEVDEDVTIDIKPEELKIDTFRAGGAGGQHVNKTDSAVRITHLPTGIVVSCQNERSQLSNRHAAMKVLKAKLAELELHKKEAELASLRGAYQEIAWGSQIRSYVFHPYSLVKDHRTGAETGNVDAVMNGELDKFMAAFLLSQVRK